MPMLNPDGSQIYGLIDPEAYCMTPEQIGEILAAAFMKTTENFIAALSFYICIAILIGFLLGCGFMWLYYIRESGNIRAKKEAEE
jgi:sensor c-di-GMP phosphodiesterase-like protein